MKQVAVRTVSVEVDQARLLRNLGHVFSDGRKVLNELLQNARRAGATAVSFEMLPGRLVVTDDGCGIEDFRALLGIAMSGWSEDVMRTDMPFGMGFASCLFSATHVVVESRGERVSFLSQDAIARKAIPVERSDFIGGSRVTLTGMSMSLETAQNALEKASLGFPIPVHLNGRELPQPLAMQNLQGERTEEGFFHLRGVHTEGRAGYTTRFFLQGLPIKVSTDERRCALLGERSLDNDQVFNVVHLDSTRFAARMPDRDLVYEAAGASARLDAAARTMARQFLQRRKAELSSLAFMELFDVADVFGCRDLYDDVPFIHRSLLHRITDYPVDHQRDSTQWTKADGHVARAEVEAGNVRVIDGRILAELTDEDSMLFAKLMVARNKGWLFTPAIPESHWVAQYALDFYDLSVSIRPVGEEQVGQVCGAWISGAVRAAEAYEVIVDLDARGKRDATMVTEEPFVTGEDRHECVVYVPGGCLGGDAVRQSSSYQGEYDYHGDEEERDAAEIESVVQILRGLPPAATLRQVLASGGARRRPNLQGIPMVCLVKDGHATVETLAELLEGAFAGEPDKALALRQHLERRLV